MTQPAQSSGHEWVSSNFSIQYGRCSCQTTDSKWISPTQWQVHVASAAQAAQPQEVPAEQRVLTAEEIAYKATTHECGWAEYHINALVASKIAEAIAQPASAAKPAEDGLRQCHAGECRDEMIWRDVIAARERELRALAHPPKAETPGSGE